ncbi:hypothetical protein J31TS4_12270 [Paenibacillus sp. J31TS4]|uniref:zinc dependent phospholipase C family protein n=1 Tax=Paenibacillus sp. J31TS4 TaxID=2807195 RepID=UPI001AFED160|nr:zinc dependent phospholipase C family protein [Paenibacillus sp. J31TS4]GIP37947.1 hypothetical protein J31TS4_12270 [Paenibacillus sp. J31TS4]
MGSRIMHYCIASQLADRLGIDNKPAFLLGGIAPDIHGLMNVPKGVTHFKDRDAAGNGYINYNRFYDTYKEVIQEPFYLGYLCHLLSDVVWLELYYEIVEPGPPEQMKEYLQTAYRDFRRLNGRLIKQYELKLLSHELPEVNLEGYDADYLPALLTCLQQDFVMDEELMNEELELFRNDNSEIAEYIDRSTEKCLLFLSSKGIES